MSKRGRLSREERDFIHAQTDKLTPEDIADRLDRTVETVTEFIKLNVRPVKAKPSEAEETTRIVIRQELRSSEAWKNLKGEFDTDELRYFEEGYVKLMSQFKGDVLPSEETQIFQAIKFEILMSRNLKERRKAREDIGRLERMQDDFLAQFEGDPSGMTDAQKAFALDLETQLNSARQAEQSRTTEYVKLQERHEALMKSLKAVRDQRIKQIENSKVSFLGVVKMLMEKDVQHREGRQMELMKRAGRQALTDLGRPVRYDDGNEDSPILSSDTVDLGPEEETDVES
jgi:hypothetical protein